MKLTFKVPGNPVGQPRVKAFSRGGRAGVYTPTKTTTGKSNGVAEFKAAVKIMARDACSTMFDGPVKVSAEFVFPRQATHIWKTKPMPRYWKVSKPDTDNLVKGLLDALTGVLWRDDNQVCAVEIVKCHCAGDETPHVLVNVETLE